MKGTFPKRAQRSGTATDLPKPSVPTAGWRYKPVCPLSSLVPQHRDKSVESPNPSTIKMVWWQVRVYKLF